ncbi:hypothetical protein DRQ33_07755 [bacterium]|nr:MAG: hypothetical protein DRQ33_07755 [bacterium]
MGLFKSKEKQVWREFAEQIDAEFIEGGFLKGNRVEKKYKSWRIIMDKYSTDKMSFTRVRAPYISSREFKFKIYHKNIFSKLGKMLGMQDIKIGNPKFDDEYIIKSSDPAMVMSLLADGSITELIQKLQPPSGFNINSQIVKRLFGTKFPPNTYQIHYEQTNIVTDKQRLNNIFQIFMNTLDKMKKMGVAIERDPFDIHKF